MKIFNSIEDLRQELNISRKVLYPDFFIFKIDEINSLEKVKTFPHFKRFFEILFYEENTNQVKIGHTTINDLNDSISFTSPMQSLSITQIKKPTGYSILINPSFFASVRHQYDIQKEFSFFKLNSKPTYKINTSEKLFIKNILDHIYLEYDSSDEFSLEIIQGHLIVLLNFIKRISRYDSSIIKLKRYEELTLEFEALILKESKELKTIADFANTLNITPIYLSECVKKSTGFTAKKILIDYQMLRAKSLLLQTSETIEAISYKMGFKEPTNFTKFFKNNEGITPLAFRKLP